MWCVARFRTMCTILKTWKTPMEECYFFAKSNTLPWVFFTFLKFLRMVPNCAKHHAVHSTHVKLFKVFKNFISQGTNF